MTSADIKDVVNDAVDSPLGKILQSLALAAILAMSGWTLVTLNEHSVKFGVLEYRVGEVSDQVKGITSDINLGKGEIQATKTEIESQKYEIKEQKDEIERLNDQLESLSKQPAESGRPQH